MSARVLYDAFVSDPVSVDVQPAVFHSWLRGLTAAELIADLPAQLHRHFQVHQSTSASTPQQRRPTLRKKRHRQRPSVSSSSSSPSSPSSPSSLPPRILSSPPTGSPNISRRPSAADDRLDAVGTPHTIIHQLAALHIPAAAASNATAVTAAEDSPRSSSPSPSSDSDSSDDELHQAAAALTSAAYGRLLTAAQHTIHTQYRVFASAVPLLPLPAPARLPVASCPSCPPPPSPPSSPPTTPSTLL